MGAKFQMLFFLQFSYCLMFLNIQIDLIILKTYDQQFTLTTKKSLHIIFKLHPTNQLCFRRLKFYCLHFCRVCSTGLFVLIMS